MSKQSQTWISVALTTCFAKEDKAVVAFREQKKELEVATKEFIAQWLSQRSIPYHVVDPIMETVRSNVAEVKLERGMAQAAQRATFRAAFLFVFDHFAVVTSEVMEAIGKDRTETLSILNHLERKGLIGGDYNESEGVRTDNRRARPGSEKIWQCIHTYDEINRMEAENRFSVEYPWTDEMEAAAKAAQPVVVDGPVGLVVNGALITGPESK